MSDVANIKNNPFQSLDNRIVPERDFARIAATLGDDKDVSVKEVKDLSTQLKLKIGNAEITLSDLKKMKKAGQLGLGEIGDKLYNAAIYVSMDAKKWNWDYLSDDNKGTLNIKDVDALEQKIENDINKFGENGQAKIAGSTR
jgi:hypothetical protein